VYGVKLFQLAEALGITQNQAATALGLARTQTHLWAHGKRAIPEVHLEKLLEMVGQAADAALEKLDAESSTLREEFSGERSQLKDTILSLCEDVRMEMLERAGVGPTAMVAGSLAALSKFTGMNPEEFRKGDTPIELMAEATRLFQAAQLLQRLEPLERVLERGKRASGAKSTSRLD
jgi:transcriptional regulator with XRE-family HTH domain